MPGQVPVGSAPPGGTKAHIPFEPVTPQLQQGSQLPLSQQTPSVQKPLGHWEPVVQESPRADCATQWLLPSQ
jgi:hypothetical protein